MNEPKKNAVLRALARLLAENAPEIIAANRLDINNCPKDDAVIFDRLKLDETKIGQMISSVKNVIDAPDPVGRIIYSKQRENGLKIQNRTVPFGTILIIYEARPDVSVEAAIIALKAGNRILLKGGKEARNTNLCLANLWKTALAENNADTDFVKYLDISRAETQKLIQGDAEKFDLVIPRGGETLIDFVLKNSKSPVIVSGRGNNFLFVDAEADFEKALAIIVNGKSRLSVCNALDKVLIDEHLPGLDEKINRIVAALQNQSIAVVGDSFVHRVNSSVQFFGDEETWEEIWFEEFLAAKIVVAVVADIAAAVEKINQYSGGHSAAIITENAERAAQFMQKADCAAVYHNASVRFTDGGEFGLGAEIAISTQKLHFRGPLGAEHLLTNKWFVFGNGQIRK